MELPFFFSLMFHCSVFNYDLSCFIVFHSLSLEILRRNTLSKPLEFRFQFKTLSQSEISGSKYACLSLDYIMKSNTVSVLIISGYMYIRIQGFTLLFFLSICVSQHSLDKPRIRGVFLPSFLPFFFPPSLPSFLPPCPLSICQSIERFMIRNWVT